MQYLKDNPNTKTVILQELSAAKIIPINYYCPISRDLTSVSTTIVGGLLKGYDRKFTFIRQSNEWLVIGILPLDVAQQMYAALNGRTCIRVAGECGCPPPEDWVAPDMDALISRGLLDSGMTVPEMRELSRRFGVPLKAANFCIDCQEGLNLFVQVVKQAGLVD